MRQKRENEKINFNKMKKKLTQCYKRGYKLITMLITGTEKAILVFKLEK